MLAPRVEKPVVFCDDSLDAVREFPSPIRRETGFQIDRVQRGLEPDDWKPMTSVGRGCCEIRARDDSGTYRVIYVATLGDAVYVLSAFKKKSRTTPKRELELAKARYNEIVRGNTNG